LLSGVVGPDASAEYRDAAPRRPVDTVTRDDLRAHFLRGVVDGSGERPDLDEVGAAESRQLGEEPWLDPDAVAS